MTSKIDYVAILKSPRSSTANIDEIRQENAAYHYLCHLEEARIWIEECIKEKLPRSTELEARLRNGVYLAKLANFIAPHVVPIKKIFDVDQDIYESSGLHYRHTDNINHWILAMKAVGLPTYFYPNSFDVYGKKNMPKAVYCLHALNIYLHRCGRGIKIMDLIGKIQFSPDEINSVSNEFKEFGIQLPAFSKIRGILANEMSPTDATLHAAIVAINIAIYHQNNEHLLAAMKNPNAQLQNVFEGNALCYQRALSQIKSKRAAEVKSKTASHRIGLCWEFLSQKIIQEEIDLGNMNCILKELQNSVTAHCTKDFLRFLQSPLLNISDVSLEYVEAYMSRFKEVLESFGPSFLDQESVQTLISTVNYSEHQNNERAVAVMNLNNILATDDYFSSFNILKSLTGAHLHDFGRQFYHVQLENQKINNGRSLTLNDLQENLPKLTALLDISVAVIQENTEDILKSLSNPEIKCWELYDNLKEQYFASLNEINLENNMTFFTVEEVKKCISDINVRFELEQNEINLTKDINIALSSNNISLLINSLIADPSILSIDTRHTELYFNLLSKSQQGKVDLGLTRGDIQSQINLANKIVLNAEYHCACLASINMSIDNKDSEALIDSLKMLGESEKICCGCKDKYLEKLFIEKQDKLNQYNFEQDIFEYSWIKWEVSPDIVYFLNMKTLESAWNVSKENSFSLFLTKEEILKTVSEVLGECDCHKYEVLKTFISSFQAHCRGYILRQSISAKKTKLSRSYTPVHAKAAVKVQSFLRMSIVRKKYLKEKSEKLRLTTAARIIQRTWRAFKVHKNLNILTHSANPPLPLMQQIIYMLEISNDDYSEEFKLHTVQGKAVQTIRYNQTLLKEIDEMDIKIGLLIRNRITLEDLLLQKKKASSTKMKKKDNPLIDIKNRGFKLFSKKYNTLIESFENLLYLLQTKPEYLSCLIVSLPSNQATTFIESIIFSLYNYGSTPREEYLLLKLLCLTLNEEIKLRGDDQSDIIKGENIIMKIIISFYRKSYWQNCLKNLLEPLVTEVLNDECVLYSIDPIEIYKVWQNELETESGKKSVMPHELSVDDALSHLEVNDRFNQFLDNLLKYSLTFCEAIVNGQELIPYGIMYVCKFLKMSLQKKYPASSTQELNKIIGNFLYYRYINPAVIAPDVFDIINTQSKQIADYERMKLSAIAKFLHLSVTGKKYTEDTPHLMCLNPYLSDCHLKFMSFFDDISNVKSLEEQFNIDIFSEAIVQIPEVYMSLKELKDLHKLLVEKEYDIAPDSNDILHEVLEDFSLNSFDDICKSSDEFLNTEVCLSLKSKYDLEVDDESEEEKLFVETKFMLITLLQVYQNVNCITDLLDREPTEEEEMHFERICFMKQRGADSRNWKTLPALQSALQFNLNSLELKGYVNSTNNYQDILNSIAKDIVNRWRYRISRKKEIIKLLEIQKQLDNKTVFYLEKLDYYNKYIAVCLENMKVGKRNSKLFICRSSTAELINYKTVKCSGSKLYEKGILIEIKDLDSCQFKNVNFEISPAEDLGIFIIRAKFMGVPLETVDIDIQELLCMQYQGISEMNMFDCVKINNNLLLHFLNSKFYSKSVP